MDAFFTYLKQAREASGIPLEEISDQTLINLKMLEALERGDVGALPQAYIRAFIREYASTIGLDPHETLRRYDAWRAHQAPAEPMDEREAPPRERKAKSKTLPSVLSHIPIAWKIIVAIVVLVLLDIVVWGVLQKEPTQHVREVPFREVVKEVESRAALNDSARATGFGALTASVEDSLTLAATTTDSVWMEMIVDDSLRSQHFLYPNTSKRWKAKSRFTLLTIGNPTAIAFTLDNKPVPIPIRRGYVTRNVTLDRSSVQ